MASGIDATKPVAGNASTSNVRANFSTAETEINELHRFTEDQVAATGTANALAANFTTDVVLANGVTVTVEAVSANTGSATLDADGAGAKTIRKFNQQLLAAGDIAGPGHFCVFKFNAGSDTWTLLNPGVAPDASELGGNTSAFHLARTNHTGAQAQSTVTNLVADLALKAPLASPALTGTPTAPTAAVGTNTTQSATTEYVQQEFDGAQQSKVTNGFQKLPGGLILQWGRQTVSSGTTAVTFPLTFPTACFVASATDRREGDTGGVNSSVALKTNPTTTTLTLSTDSGQDEVHWFAIGH